MGTGFFSNKKGIKEAKEAAGAIQYAGAQGIEAVDASKAQAQAAEQAKFSVYGLLGKPGTYGPDAPDTTGIDFSSENAGLFDTSGEGLSQANQNLRQMTSYSTGGGKLRKTPREGILDPEAYANAVSKTSAFKIQSQRVAESESLLNKEGPEWDMLENSVIGSIDQGSAIMLRDTLRQLKNQHAKGGSARREALNNFNIILAEERAMRDRVEGTWKANIALYDMVRKNADAVAEGTSYFMANLPLVNDTYRSSIASAAAMSIQAGNVAAAAAQNAYAVKQSQQATNFGVKLGEALIGAVASMVPYVGQVLGPAIKQAGSSGGYQAVGSSTTGSSEGYGGGASSGTLQNTIASFGQGGGGNGMLSTGQVGTGMAAVGNGASNAWSSTTAFFGSDIRLKENLEQIGTENGHNIYKFNYKGDPDHTYAGVLAHEVIEKNPDAVEIYAGHYFVDYNRIGIKMRAI